MTRWRSCTRRKTINGSPRSSILPKSSSLSDRDYVSEWRARWRTSSRGILASPRHPRNRLVAAATAVLKSQDRREDPIYDSLSSVTLDPMPLPRILYAPSSYPARETNTQPSASAISSTRFNSCVWNDMW